MKGKPTLPHLDSNLYTRYPNQKKPESVGNFAQLTRCEFLLDILETGNCVTHEDSNDNVNYYFRLKKILWSCVGNPYKLLK